MYILSSLLSGFVFPILYFITNVFETLASQIFFILILSNNEVRKIMVDFILRNLISSHIIKVTANVVLSRDEKNRKIEELRTNE